MVIRSPLPRVSRRGRVTIAVVVALLILLSVFDRIIDLWTDWLWYGEVHYTNVFGGVLRTRLLLFLVFGLVMTAFVGGNYYLAYRLRPIMRGAAGEALERYRTLFAPRMTLWIWLLGGVIGLFAGLAAQSSWQDWMLFRNGGSFGTLDPQYAVDAGFYVFKYPFYRDLLDFGFTATALALIGSIGVHYLFGGFKLQSGARLTTAARTHLTSLIAFFVALKAVAYYLDRRGLVLDFNSGTDLWGAGYTGINAVLPAKNILIYISVMVAIAIVVFSNLGSRNLIWAGAALALLGISAVAIGGIYPAVVQQFTVKPNIRDKEADYIKRTIDGTRNAYGLTAVEASQYPANTITPPDTLATDKTVVPTIRLLDPAVVPDTFTQFQQIRSFYDFNEKLDVDRYNVNGRLQDFVVGVREMNYSKLSGQQTNWQNRHTVFTHGYGFVAAPANQTCDGQPVFVSGLLSDQSSTTVDSAACTSATDQIKVTEPRVYYGELSGDSDYVIVGKSSPSAADAEFDRPFGDSEQHYSYQGTGGVPVSSFGRRLLYALHFRDTNFLLSDVFNDNSKLIYIRDPAQRVQRVAPFLTLDGDPYPAVINGRITWIVDGYTTSATYPYSQRIDLRDATTDANTGTGTVEQARQDINYIRNSVKATVDAYNGTVTLYQFDDQDPILAAWNKAFGGNLIKPKASIPPELAAHFRYPEDLFKVQRDLEAKFHVSDPKEFNGGQDFWQVPDDPARHTPGVAQPPYFLLTQFPGEDTPTFQLTAALTPNSRQNLAALLSGTYGDDGKPHLRLLELPRENLIPGPGQASQAMQTDNDVRGKLTQLQGLASQTQLEYGNLLSLPYQGGLLYVQPVYLKSANATNPYPLLRLVLVDYGKTVASGETLAEAIAELVQNGKNNGNTGNGGTDNGNGNGNGSGNGNGGTSPELAAAAQQIQKAIDALHAAQASGNFQAYGKALQDLDAAVKAFEAAQAKAGSGTTTTPTPTPTS